MPKTAAARHGASNRTTGKAEQSSRRTRDEVVKTLWPGQPGTVKLLRQYGDRLFCVRYRQDQAGLNRATTIELVVDRAPISGLRFNQRLFAVRITIHELDLRQRIKARGGRWDPDAKVWVVPGKVVRELQLENRVRHNSKPKKQAILET
jgi:hypothetical protein